MDLNRKQWLGIGKITAVLLGLLAAPLLLQRYFNVNAIHAAFVIIVIYAVLNWWMKNH